MILNNHAGVTEHFAWKTHGISMISGFKMRSWFQSKINTKGISMILDRDVGVTEHFDWKTHGIFTDFWIQDEFMISKS